MNKNGKANNITRLLFVCHGNICRSPMAEAIMEKLVQESGSSDKFSISSAAVSDEAIGQGVYPATNRMLKEHGITSFSHIARKMTGRDYDDNDLIVVMDESNLRLAKAITRQDPEGKIRKLNEADVDDPWYTGDFRTAYGQIESGCKRLLRELLNANAWPEGNG